MYVFIGDIIERAGAYAPFAFLLAAVAAACTGFEDLVTLSRESQGQSRATPRAIVLTLLVAMVLHVLGSAVVVIVLWDELLLAGPAAVVRNSAR
ncbi:hypothetical protein K3152_13525 [Qipengyuania sp. 1NDH17]|uniref:Amino acid permease/ SLC12A domain-containing protein n=1 Tax=Qipengyuania polymorpha TaxID=2867234 RepID=A0ABS7J0L5_9SPHN|nr:hypothetical protein [Qipengyuania polymorpha]MBX7459268.1 hypothetical protein [Qipengyuania polymorpha]